MTAATNDICAGNDGTIQRMNLSRSLPEPIHFKSFNIQVNRKSIGQGRFGRIVKCSFAKVQAVVKECPPFYSRDLYLEAQIAALVLQTPKSEDQNFFLGLFGLLNEYQLVLEYFNGASVTEHREKSMTNNWLARANETLKAVQFLHSRNVSCLGQNNRFFYHILFSNLNTGPHLNFRSVQLKFF